MSPSPVAIGFQFLIGRLQTVSDAAEDIREGGGFNSS